MIVRYINVYLIIIIIIIKRLLKETLTAALKTITSKHFEKLVKYK